MTTQPTAPRRDAARNRARIVEAAREAFAERGLDVPLDAVAKAAGVGAGTLYRHFPTREDLVAAVLEGRRPDLERERREIADDPALDSVAALERWLDALARWMRAYDGLPAPLRTAADATGTALGITCAEVIATTETFLAPVREEGRARPDVDARDLYMAVLGITWAVAGSVRADEGAEPRLLGLLHSGWGTGRGGATP